MDVLEPSEVEFRENTVHMTGQSTTAFEGRRRSHSTRKLCRYTTVHSLQSRGSSRRPTDNEGSRAAYLPDIILPAPAAPVRASLALR